ncbi:MAG TPA: C-terminal helicase domain-containing protein, partial [Polyangiales bacterium]|nr:C-terminal helicase domain-containing protein [Polyangiales bacterium]
NMLRLSHWAVQDLLSAAGMRAVFFTGAESPKLRERSIIELHDDPSTTMMFLSDAGGVGLNLQRAASCCVNLELPWNPAVLEQRIARIYRLGQPLPIDVYNLVTEEGIEANIAQLLSKKSAVFSSLFDGTSDSVSFDGTGAFMEGVRKLVEAVPMPAEPLFDDSPDDELLEPMAEPLSPPSQAVAAGSEDSLVQPERASAQGLSVARLADGRLRIEAPPELAAPLADLFETLARSLRAPTAERSADG